MIKVLVVLIWPALIGAALCVAALLHRAELANGVAVQRRWAVAGQSSLQRVQRAMPGLPQWVSATAIFVAIVVAGAILVYGVMALLGLLVVHHGSAIDQPIYHWTIAHRVHGWASVMKRLTKIGDTWTTWGAGATAAVCLGVARKDRKWLPALALIAVIVVDHFATLAIRGTFARPGPPDSPGGTFPSGGCDRVILFYGTIAYFLWRDFSGRRRAAVWATAAVVALAFNEAYSRLYLTLHWFTDVLSGLLYGSLLLGTFLIAIGFAERASAVEEPAVARSEPGVLSEAPLQAWPDYVAR